MAVDCSTDIMSVALQSVWKRCSNNVLYTFVDFVVSLQNGECDSTTGGNAYPVLANCEREFWYRAFKLEKSIKKKRRICWLFERQDKIIVLKSLLISWPHSLLERMCLNLW